MRLCSIPRTEDESGLTQVRLRSNPSTQVDTGLSQVRLRSNPRTQVELGLTRSRLRSDPGAPDQTAPEDVRLLCRALRPTTEMARV